MAIATVSMPNNQASERSGRNSKAVSDSDAHAWTRVEELAYDLRVREVMTPNPDVVSPDMRMSDLLVLLRKKRISGAPVVDNGKLVGLISLEDLIRSMLKHDLGAYIQRYMSHQVIITHSFDPVIEAIELFDRHRIGRLPVIDEQDQLVGIITKGDITRGVLHALQKDFHAEELRRYRASHLFEDIQSDRTSLILRYHIHQGDFVNGGAASGHIKRALLRLGAPPQIARRCGIATYEAEMNLIIHTLNGGLIRAEIEPSSIRIVASDRGPGIPDIEQAMQPGFSTATQEIRELGFGAGMGLQNIKRCVDQMTLESKVGHGTKLVMKIFLDSNHNLKDNSDLET